MTDTAERFTSQFAPSSATFTPERTGRHRAAGLAIALSASAVLWVGIIGAFVEIAHLAL
jgi:hypothetical protein